MENKKIVIVVPKQVAKAIYDYLNLQPRVETNEMCSTLEKCIETTLDSIDFEKNKKDESGN